MKVFSLKRLIGAAAIYGIVRYVKANGGPQAVFDTLKERVSGMMGAAKSTPDNSFATNTGRGPSRFESSGVADKTPSSYASYKVDDDKNLH